MGNSPKEGKRTLFSGGNAEGLKGKAERGLQKLFCLAFSPFHDIVCCSDFDTYMKYFNENKS